MNGFFEWFELLFPPAMFLLAAVPTLFFRTVRDPDLEEAEQRARVRFWTRWLWLATAAATVLHLVLFLLVAPEVGEGTWPLFFGLWFGLAMPLLRAKNPTMFHAPHMVMAQRAATLRRRDPIVPIPAILAGIAVWAALTVATVTLLATREQEQPLGWQLLLFSFGGLCFMLGFGMGGRKSVEEPEPMDPAGSRELARAYESLRRQRAWMFFWLGVVGMLIFSVPALLLAWDNQRMLIPAIAAGAGGGTLVGILGGIMGAHCSVRRGRINALLTELSESGTGNAFQTR